MIDRVRPTGSLGDPTPATSAHCSRGQRGQTLAVVAMMLVILIGSLALVVDLGHAFAQRRAMQNAADAAALAGARALALAEGADTARAVAFEYAVHRGGAETCAVTLDDTTVTVVVSRTFGTYFASIIGVPTMPVAAQAKAGYTIPTSWTGDLLPIALHTNALTLTGTIRIWDDDKAASDPARGIIADGQRGWLNFNGGSVGDSEIVDWVTNGYPGRVEVDSWVNGTPGTKTAALHAMDLVRTHTVIFVPVYDGTRAGQLGSGSLDYRIVAFAAFYVTKVVDTGNPKYVQGQFRRWVTAQESGGWIDSGVRIVGLK